MVEYVVQLRISSHPAFELWILHVLAKCNRIVVNQKSKYRFQMQKFYFKIPKSVQEAKLFDEENGSTIFLGRHMQRNED